MREIVADEHFKNQEFVFPAAQEKWLQLKGFKFTILKTPISLLLESWVAKTIG